MRINFSFAATWFLLLFSLLCFSQPKGYILRNYTTANGLPHDHVKCLAFDNDGFLWIGTWANLSRFDGNEFVNYYSDPNDSTALPYADITNLQIDRFGNIWVMGPYTASLYLPEKDYFHTYNLSSRGQHNSDFQIIYSAATDPDGQLWLLTNAGFRRFNYETDGFADHNNIDIGDPVFYGPFCFDDQWNIWVSNIETGIIYRLEAVSGLSGVQYRLSGNFPVIPPIKPLGSNHHLFIKLLTLPDASWLVSNVGIFRLDESTRSFISRSPEEVLEEYSGYDTLVWYDPSAGLCALFPVRHALIEIPLTECEHAETFLVTSDGSMFWGGPNESGLGRGLAQALSTGDHFRYFTPEGHPDISIFGLAEDDHGNIWFGSREFLCPAKITPYGRLIRYPCPDMHNPETSRHIRSILCTGGGLWLGYLGNRLLHYDYSKDSFHMALPSPGLQEYPKSCRTLLLDRQGRLIVGGDYDLEISLVVVDTASGNIMFHRNIPGMGGIYSLIQDPSGTVWVGSSGKLIRLDESLQTYRTFRISNYNIESLYWSEDNGLWMGLLGGGLCRFDPSSARTEYYTMKDGLQDNYVYHILPDEYGNLWCSTNSGLSVYQPVRRAFRNFGINQGLRIREFNSEAACIAANGEMIFGGVGGMVRFHPDSVLQAGRRLTSAPLHITALSVQGERFLAEEPVYHLKKISLPRGTSQVRIEFACLDYRNASDIRYRYRLEGFDRDWVYTGSKRRFENYANLRHGSYRFEVEATDAAGDWSNHAGITITIPPWYYQTLIFKIAVALLASGLIFLILYSRYRQQVLRLVRLKDRTRLEALRSQLNPHFIFNALNSVNDFILSNDQEMANRYVADFSALMRLFLNNSASDFIPLAREIDTLEKYLLLEHLRFGDRFGYTIDVPEEIDTDHTMVVPSLVQPFVENAVWHGVARLEGRKGHVMVRFGFGKPGCVLCTVEDDGVGRKASELRKTNYQQIRQSRGMGLIRERLQIYNKLLKTRFSITVSNLYTDRPETGTRVEIEIPVKPKSKSNF
ncbi:MAG: histidine kinase [Bacteroidales bacterium]|nr:histidine kinase [Bacteroidales bacterium]